MVSVSFFLPSSLFFLLTLFASAKKVIAARDEKKNLICWSIAYDKAATAAAPAAGLLDQRVLDENRTFAVASELLSRGWQLGPDGSDRAEVFLFKIVPHSNKS